MTIPPVDWEKIEKDKEEKKSIVLEYVTSQCTDSSPIQDFRDIGLALQQGDKLLIKILPAGLANYTYKLYLESSPRITVFAKLSFPYAVLFPDKYFDVERTSNEFKVMEKFATIAPGCVAVPYLCVSIEDMKLLVTQWCSADEQLANQFIDGCVDSRAATKLAHAIASLHCIDFDPNFNSQAREFMRNLAPEIGEIMDTLASDTDTEDRTATFIKTFEKELCDTIKENLENDLDNIDCLLHGDLHVFNTLVEEKPDLQITLNNFGPDGSVMICDWEMSFAGPIGRDIGFFHSFPLACALAHAINGCKEASHQILDYLTLLWDEYSNTMMTKGEKDSDDMSRAFRTGLGYCGAVLLCYYKVEFRMNLLPVEQQSPNYITIKDAMGVLGLKLLRWGFGRYDCDLTLNELRVKFKETILDEVEHAFAANKSKLRTRRSSVLRSSGRRVSDAPLHHHVMDRLSLSTLEEMIAEE